MDPKPKRIVVVDDDPELRALLQRFLSEHGYAVRAVEGGTALDRALARDPADMIILDLMMPGEDGLAICRRLKAAGDPTPIIMLTAKGDPIDRVVGLEMGADDYLAKPFLPRELLARISAVYRRLDPDRLVQRGADLAVGPFRIDTARRTVTRDGAILDLSGRAFALLIALARSAGRPLSRAQLIERALGRDAEVTDRAIDVQVTRLRRAIGDDPRAPRFIKTVWGIGYMMSDDDPA